MTKNIPLTDLIQYALDLVAKQRKEEAENSGWMVQYFPCGHSREIGPHEIELVERAKANTRVDAIIESSDKCPECLDNRLRMTDAFWWL